MAEGLHVLVVSQFFPPEMGAPAARFHDLGRHLIEHGHRVTVLTGLPNSPSGVVPREYRGRPWRREEIDGIRVLRTWLYCSPRLSPLTKALGFATFAGSAALRGLFAGNRADVVIATAPPPTVFVPGMLIARRIRAPLVTDVRDIWPEAIAASGRLRSGPLIRLLESIELRGYRESAAITVVTEGKRDRLIERGVPGDRIHVIPNGVDLARFGDEIPVDEALQAAGVDPGRFLVVYAGVFNPPQGLDVILDAADLLRKRAPEEAEQLQFVLVGDGSERRRLQERCRNEGLEDLVRLMPVQPRERIPSLLRRCSAVAITLRPRRDTHTVPSKIFEAMASGRPVVVSADGAPAHMVEEAGAGLATPASDAEGLARSVRRLCNDPEFAARLGAAGAAHAASFDRASIGDRLDALLRAVSERGSVGRGSR